MTRKSDETRAETQLAVSDLDHGLRVFGGFAVPGWAATEEAALAAGWTPPHRSTGYRRCVCGVATAWVAPDGRHRHPYCAKLGGTL